MNLEFSDVIRMEIDALSKDGNRLSDVFKACIKSVAAWPIMAYRWIKEKIGDGVDYVAHTSDDNVHIRDGQKTSLGMDFRDIYPNGESLGVEAIQTVDANGNTATINYLDFSNKDNSLRYVGEMHGTNLTFGQSTDFESLIPEHQLGYEMTLITKKYALGGTIPDENGNPMAYEDIIGKYKTYCSQNNVDFNTVVWVVSEELQSETKVATSELGHIGSSVAENAANLRYLANTSHNMLLNAVGPEYQDQSVYGIDYEQTLDTTAVPYGWFNLKALAAKEWFQAEHTNPFTALKEGTLQYFDNVSYLSTIVDKQKEMTEERIEEGNYYTATDDEALEALVDEGVVPTNTEERYAQSMAELGLSENTTETSTQADISTDVTD